MFNQTKYSVLSKTMIQVTKQNFLFKKIIIMIMYKITLLQLKQTFFLKFNLVWSQHQVLFSQQTVFDFLLNKYYITMDN